MTFAALRGVLTRMRLPVARALLPSSAPRIQLNVLRPLLAPKPKGRNWTRVGPDPPEEPEEEEGQWPDDELEKLEPLLTTIVRASALKIRHDPVTGEAVRRTEGFARKEITKLAVICEPGFERVHDFVMWHIRWEAQKRDRALDEADTALDRELARVQLRHTDLEEKVTRGWQAPALLPPSGTPVTEETRAAVWAQLKSETPLQSQEDERLFYMLDFLSMALVLYFPDDVEGSNAFEAMTVAWELGDRMPIQLRLQRLLMHSPDAWAVNDEQRVAMARELMDHNVADARSVLALHAALPPDWLETLTPGLLARAREVLQECEGLAAASPLPSGTTDAVAHSDAHAFAEHVRATVCRMLDAGVNKHRSAEFPPQLANLSWAATRLGQPAAATAYALLALQMVHICDREHPDELTRILLRAMFDCPMDWPILHKLRLSHEDVLSDTCLERVQKFFACDPKAVCTPRQAVSMAQADAALLRVIFRLADALRAVGRLEDASVVHAIAEQRRARLVLFVSKHLKQTAE